MRKTNTRTSLKITFLPEGGAYIEQKWSDTDSIRPHKDVADEILGELSRIPPYKELLKR